MHRTSIPKHHTGRTTRSAAVWTFISKPPRTFKIKAESAQPCWSAAAGEGDLFHPRMMPVFGLNGNCIEYCTKLHFEVYCFFSETSKITCPVIDIQMLSAESQRGFQDGESGMILSSKEVVCFLSDIN